MCPRKDPAEGMGNPLVYGFFNNENLRNCQSDPLTLLRQYHSSLALCIANSEEELNEGIIKGNVLTTNIQAVNRSLSDLVSSSYVNGIECYTAANRSIKENLERELERAYQELDKVKSHINNCQDQCNNLYIEQMHCHHLLTNLEIGTQITMDLFKGNNQMVSKQRAR